MAPAPPPTAGPFAIECGPITLSREKSLAYRHAETPEGGGSENRPFIELRSNRVTMPMKSTSGTVPVVMRAQNIPAAMRMSAAVVDEVRRDPGLLVGRGNVDWNAPWQRRLSKYERDFNPESWASLHIAGEQVFASVADTGAVRAVESLCAGEEVTEASILEVAQSAYNALDEFVVEHDSQTALVVNPGAQYHRASILERRDGKTTSISLSVHHPTAQKPVRLGAFMSLCADVMEAMAQKTFLDRIERGASVGRITPAQVAALRARRRELVQNIEAFEKANRVAYRPDRPVFV